VGAVRSGLGCLSWIGAAVIVIALVLKLIWFDMASMGHNGMAPTLLRGERVLINKRGEPEIGSIAVCRHPTEDGWVVGRVAATGGMTIGSFGSELRIDGKPIQFDRQGAITFQNLDNDQTDLPEGKLYLLGDFRAYMGQDSRAYGVVDASTCRGTIVFRVTPAEGLDPEIAHSYFQPVR
jgi:signal peptidase I